ncbi:CPBP family intramembrane glutamic endopeptidase [Thalassotalea aquiviva]|uniref:CPBP family intramembrane glutamic endopeptidase n=1 Tax=Thalassotalea aquiviva TaxID=3242415 RepID=UPI00352B72A7
MDIKRNLKPGILLFTLGVLGIVSLMPVIAQLISLQSEPLPMPLIAIQLISTVQSSVLLLIMLVLGFIFSQKVDLKAPVIFAFVESKNVLSALKPQLKPSIIGGVAGGVLILLFYALMHPYLPAEFLSSAEQLVLPWYSKLLYGGITEELLLRWGLMSFIVWLSYRFTQPKGADIGTHNYVLAIILSALIFGIAHLPVAFALSSEITVPLISYIILGNAGFGFIAGFLFWKKGLECAILAHMVAHLTMIMATVLM